MPSKIISKLEKAFVYELVELICKTDALPISGKLSIIFFFSSKFSDHLPWDKIFVGTRYISTFNCPTAMLFSASILGQVLEVRFPLTLMMCACCEDNNNPFAD